MASPIIGKAPPQYKRKDLISLVWPANVCYCSLIAGVPKGVTVDLKSGTWTFKNQTQLIGSRRYPAADFTGHPIGVYDRTNLQHLRTMKDDIEWLQNRNRPALREQLV